MTAYRGVVAAGVVAMAAAAAQGAEARTYKGTFKDGQGRLGPLQCELAPADGGKWTANFDAENKGQGPNRPLKCSGEFTGADESGKLNLTGEVVIGRQGPFVVTAVLAGDALTASFRKKDGGGDGTFELAAVKPAEPAAAAAPEPKAQ